MSRFSNSNNPLLKEEKLRGPIAIEQSGPISTYQAMTMSGAINKSLTLFGILLLTSFIGYSNPSAFLMYAGLGGGLIAFFAAMFKPHWSPYAAPAYAAFEGLFVGAISFMFATMADGIVFQAASLTFATLFMMLMIYRSGFIKVTSKFRTGVMMATGAIFLVYVVSFVGSFMGFNVPYIHENGPIGIGISVVIIGVAALNLLLDFDMFEKGVEQRAPKYMEWYVGMALLVTLVWLYIEFLRLIAKLQSD